MGSDVRVLGVGTVPFAKPSKGGPYDEMGEAAARASLADAGLDYRDAKQAYVGYVYVAATGLAQYAEPMWQLRGQTGARQGEDASLALQPNLGPGGACVATLYEKVDG